MYHTSKGRGQNRTHVELKLICPLSNQTVARVRGVGRLVLKDVIPARGISVLVKHDWGASAPFAEGKKMTDFRVKQGSFHLLCHW